MLSSCFIAEVIVCNLLGSLKISFKTNVAIVFSIEILFVSANLSAKTETAAVSLLLLDICFFISSIPSCILKSSCST